MYQVSCKTWRYIVDIIFNATKEKSPFAISNIKRRRTRLVEIRRLDGEIHSALEYWSKIRVHASTNSHTQ